MDEKRRLIADFCGELSAKIDANPDMSYAEFSDTLSDMVADLSENWPEDDDEDLDENDGESPR